MGETGHLHGFPVRDRQLVIGGLPLESLAARIGSTPFFAYDRARLGARVEHFRACMPRQVRLSYAIKANPMPAVVHHMAGLVDGFDVASGGELRIALNTPMAPERVSFAGPGKTAAELEQAVSAGILLSLESERQLRMAADLGERLGARPRVVVRINPDFTVRRSGMTMGGGPQPFGIDAEDVPEALRLLGELDLEFVGFQIFAGSQCLSPEVISATQRESLKLVVRLSEAAPSPVRHINLGGGFGIPYFANERPLDLRPIGEALGDHLATILEPALPDSAIVIELGRYLVGEAGVYVTRIIDRKRSRGRTILVTDGGMHHHLAASGNLGQVVRRNFPVAIGNRAVGGPRERVSVVGCLCTPLDLLAKEVELPKADVGDLFVVFQSGAYGLSASPVGFLGHPVPAEVLV